MTLRRLRSAAKLLERDEARRIAVNAEGAVPMDDYPHATDNALDQTEQELLVSTVSDEALEKAGCGAADFRMFGQSARQVFQRQSGVPYAKLLCTLPLSRRSAE
jgi:hypothetical protein